MAKDYWKIIIGKLRDFWKQGDQIVCTKVFKKPNSECELCGHTPITWNHVLLNERTKAILIVGSECVVNFKKVIEKLGSEDKVLYFEKYKNAANLLNSRHKGTAEIIQFPKREIMMQLYMNPEKFDYKKIKSIMDYTSEYEKEEDKELFDIALQIWVERKYYIYENLEHHGKGDNAEEIIRKYIEDLEEEAVSEIEQSYRADAGEYEGFFEELSIDDLTPEGMGWDEIDWDSHKFD